MGLSLHHGSETVAEALKSVKIITLFPEFFASPLSTGLLGKAVQSGILRVECVNLRDYSEGSYNQCDDYPYGGGSGMVLMPGPLFRALDAVKAGPAKVLLTTPSGALLDQETVKKLSREEELCIVCGHYEGVDDRIRSLVDEELSVGDYVVTGGEIPAMIVTDSVVRLLPGVLADPVATAEESFGNDGLLEYPQFTRPETYKNMRVPDILLSGNHAAIAKWRSSEARKRTKERRPDLLAKK